jgi:ATP-binding cassette subfamily F protein 3
MHSVELLADALMKYEGTYIFVSHDRYFISKAANKIWEIEDEKIKEFAGGYEEWVAWKARMAAAGQQGRTPKSAPAPAAAPKSAPVAEPSPKSSAPAPINKELKKELQKQQKAFQQLEEQLASLNKRQAELQEQLQLPDIYADHKKFQATESELKQVSSQLKQLNTEYEKVFEKIMELESGMGS